MKNNITKGTIVYTRNKFLGVFYDNYTPHKVLSVNRENKTYNLRNLETDTIVENVAHIFVVRMARKHLCTKLLLKSLKEKGKLFADYVPAKLRKLKKEELCKLGYIDENEKLTSFGEHQLVEKREHCTEPNYIDTKMYEEKYGEITSVKCAKCTT
jgi:hypothetical protein